MMFGQLMLQPTFLMTLIVPKRESNSWKKMNPIGGYVQGLVGCAISSDVQPQPQSCNYILVTIFMDFLYFIDWNISS